MEETTTIWFCHKSSLIKIKLKSSSKQIYFTHTPQSPSALSFPSQRLSLSSDSIRTYWKIDGEE